ncbi:MAG: hypothetical protein AMXMBFR66_05810 [Pseudomonadota bacterium]|nr:retroviral-like aspartic protease family protein [Rubrivivax sp.]
MLPLVPMLATVLAATASAQTLAGRMGDKALLVIAGRTLVVAPGQTQAGVTLLRWDGETALIEHEGRPQALRLGAAPAALAAAAPQSGAREVVLTAGPGGHFIAEGAINGRSVRLMVDTGATLVALPQAEAERLGVELRGARTTMSQTAAGTVPAALVTLARLRVGAVELANVSALVTPAPLPYVLLGNSALERFRMQRDNDVLRLELR